ncbi:MAG: DegT/DnrJ/EryC1/StrS family aminotransferase, partial [Lachnospiraceae bacterium]|nr:DegT/DnrJ/EryC1/StrS family aminotransferase [Lachnospiraceae bacterium]
MERIAVAEPVFNGNEKKYLDECIETGWISANGRFVTDFQDRFAEYIGSKYAIACANGTVTLQLIINAMNLGEGDEVIMPSLTYVATANAVVNSGATPVFVDSDPDTWNVSPEAIEGAITHRTRAIMPVHLYGLSCDMTAIMDISERYGIPVIEDAAEAHGAKWDGRRVGGIGKAGSFSFFGNKIITCGEG